jgi:riboflavin kinase/FMN adenylyltransferase
MQVIRGLHNCRPEHHGCTITIGNFDGLHPGHMKMLEKLQLEADRLGTSRCLMSFEPLPGEFFASRRMSGDRQPHARLTSFGEKLRLLDAMDTAHRPEYLLVLPFNQQLAAMTAEAFIDQVLVQALQVKAVIIGDDFRFGADRKGDFELLKQHGDVHGYHVDRIHSHCVMDERVSSSLIREALAEGEFELASRLLGRPYTISGRVNHGEKRGRTIGFPTANIHLKRAQSPLHGVYSVTMHSQQFGDVPGIANVGRRPTVDGERVQLEVHLFDFEAQLYGEYVSVSFQHKVRDEIKFESFEALKKQIETDCEQARRDHGLRE